MNLLQSISGILKDPPPTFAFELSEAGLAVAHNARPARISFHNFEKDVIAVSPLHDNVLRPDALVNAIKAALPGGDSRKRRTAALILPDYAVRVAVLDFDSFPSDSKEQASLVRFRLKHAVPFDVESAAVSFHAQPASHKGKKIDVVIAVAPVEVITHYEAPFRLTNFHTGLVTTSMLAALELVPAEGLQILAKRTGRVLSIAVLDAGAVRLLRSIEVPEVTAEEITGFLYPTFAYIEDELSVHPETLLLCGFDALDHDFENVLQKDLEVKVQPLTSRLGTPGEFNAGLHGYVEAVGEF